MWNLPTYYLQAYICQSFFGMGCVGCKMSTSNVVCLCFMFKDSWKATSFKLYSIGSSAFTKVNEHDQLMWLFFRRLSGVIIT